MGIFESLNEYRYFVHSTKRTSFELPKEVLKHKLNLIHHHLKSAILMIFEELEDKLKNEGLLSKLTKEMKSKWHNYQQMMIFILEESKKNYKRSCPKLLLI